MTANFDPWGEDFPTPEEKQRQREAEEAKRDEHIQTANWAMRRFEEMRSQEAKRKESAEQAQRDWDNPNNQEFLRRAHREFYGYIPWTPPPRPDADAPIPEPTTKYYSASPEQIEWHRQRDQQARDQWAVASENRATQPDGRPHPVVEYLDDTIRAIKANRRVKAELEELAMQFPPVALVELNGPVTEGFTEKGLRKNPYCKSRSIIGTQPIPGTTAGQHTGNVLAAPLGCNRWNCDDCFESKLLKHARRLTDTGPVYHAQLFSPLKYEETQEQFRKLIAHVRYKARPLKVLFHRIHETRVNKETGEVAEYLHVFFRDHLPLKGTIRDWWESEVPGGKVLVEMTMTTPEKVQGAMTACALALRNDPSPKGMRYRRTSSSPGFWRKDPVIEDERQPKLPIKWEPSPENYNTCLKRLSKHFSEFAFLDDEGQIAVGKWYGRPEDLEGYARFVGLGEEFRTYPSSGKTIEIKCKKIGGDGDSEPGMEGAC